MTSAFKCPKCQFGFRVQNRFLGRVATCPKCSQKIRLTLPTAPSKPQLSGTSTALASGDSNSFKAAATRNVDVSASSATMTVPQTSSLDASSRELPSVHDRRAHPDGGGPASQRDNSVSRVQARRATRKLVRKKLLSTPQPPLSGKQSKRSVNPLWIGFATAFVVGLTGWGVYSMMFSNPSNTEEIVFADDSEDVADNGGQSRRLANPEVKLTRLPLETAEQIAARKKAEKKAAEDAENTVKLTNTIVPYLNKYCTDCHGADLQEAGIRVDRLASLDQLLAERKSWERVYRMVNAGVMPPSDHDPLPPPEEQQNVAEFLYQQLYNFDCELVYNPGRSTVQRLNRTEYNNTVQDLFGITILPAEDFPADDVGEGFDNIGDVLSLPPLLMEKYLNAAEQVANAVVDTTDYSKPQTVTLTGDKLKSARGRDGSSDGFRVMASTDELFYDFDVRASGEYEIRMVVGADQAGDEKAKFALKLSDKTLQEFEVQEHRKREKFQRREKLDAGKTHIGIAFLNDYYNEKAKDRKDRNLGVAEITLYGPLNGGQPSWPEIHEKFVTARPEDGRSVMDAATTVLKPLLKRAFRRTVADDEVHRYAGLVRRAVDDMGETYESGISLALQAILVAPDFLFRMESDPAPGQNERHLDDFEVASRLSYFLWSTMPDDELLNLATFGQLNNPETLRKQIQRMLKDDKAEALVENFAGQWLNLRNLSEVSPNSKVFTTFNDDLRRDMRRETEMLFSTVMKEDRSVEELLSADFTFVSERLAKHYGIEGVKGNEFQRVSLQGLNRAGVLTHASILTLTSNPGRTSPVKRGKWIMENIFGEAPPPPPPGVPELEETAKNNPKATLREQLAKHREDPGCAACHNAMDPLGLGLENFDAIGRWRDQDEGRPIDASGSLPSGEKFDGPVQLIDIIKNRREKFFRTMSEKMLVYAIGRGTEYYDKCTVDKCLELLKHRRHRFSALVEGIVLSDPFLKKHGVTDGIASKM